MSSRRSCIKSSMFKEKNGFIKTLVHQIKIIQRQNRFIKTLIKKITGILQEILNPYYRRVLKCHKKSKTSTIKNKKTKTKGVKVKY